MKTCSKLFKKYVFLILVFFAQLEANAQLDKLVLPSDNEIRQILIDRIDIMHQSVGMVVGIITPEGKRIISYGKMDQNDNRPLNGETIFEIGSVTKIFTALLLVNMVKQKKVSLSDSVTKYLPKRTTIPGRNGKQITLLDLATFTSGLPFAPTDINVIDPTSWKLYTDEKLYKFLSTFQLPYEIGTHWEYSNINPVLLGKALAARKGTNYELLVKKQITKPLKMTSTIFTVPNDMKDRMAVGHDQKLQNAPAMDAPVFIPAIGLRSTANDLLEFLSYFIGFKKSSINPAIKIMFETKRPGPGLEQAIGWWIIKTNPRDSGFMAFGGQTAGFATTIAFDPYLKTGVVVLSNTAKDDDGLGWHILRPEIPLKTSASEKLTIERKEIRLDTTLLDHYVGIYQPPSPGVPITIKRNGEKLVMKSVQTPAEGFVLHAEDKQNFFLKETNLQISFVSHGDNTVSEIIIHFMEQDYHAPRINKLL